MMIVQESVVPSGLIPLTSPPVTPAGWHLRFISWQLSFYQLRGWSNISSSEGQHGDRCCPNIHLMKWQIRSVVAPRKCILITFNWLYEVAIIEIPPKTFGRVDVKLAAHVYVLEYVRRRDGVSPSFTEGRQLLTNLMEIKGGWRSWLHLTAETETCRWKRDGDGRKKWKRLKMDKGLVWLTKWIT